MKNTAKQKIRLIAYIAMGIVTLIVTTLFLYQNRKRFWGELAQQTLKEVLKEEIEKRGSTEVFYSYQGSSTLNKEGKNDADTEMEIISEFGRHIYRVPAYKNSRNLEHFSKMRILQSVLFKSTPLQVDSLNQNWATLLRQIGFRGTTRIGISTTTLQEEETKVFSTGTIPHTLSDTLSAHYIGCRSEIEITGIIYYSWWSLLLGGDIILLSGVMVLFIAFVLLYEKRRWIYQRYVAKRAPIVLESNVFVNAVGSNKNHIYKIGEVCFDTNSNLLSRGEFSNRIPPQTAKLLIAFLDADERKLSTEMLKKIIWGELGTDAQMHTAVKRLRLKLEFVTDWKIENNNFEYQLKIPHFIEENRVE